MSSLFSQAEADEAVITSLLKEIKELRRYLMVRIIKDALTGQLYSVDDEQVIAVEQAQEALAHAKAKAAELESVLGVEAAEGTVAPEPAPEAPTLVEEAPAPDPAPAEQAAEILPPAAETPPAPEPVVLS